MDQVRLVNQKRINFAISVADEVLTILQKNELQNLITNKEILVKVKDLKLTDNDLITAKHSALSLAYDNYHENGRRKKDAKKTANKILPKVLTDVISGRLPT